MKTPIPLPVALCALVAISTGHAEEIIRESFEGATSPLYSSTGLISSPDQFYLAIRDFWTATDGTTPAIESATGSPAYTGQDGSRYWAGQDMDADGEGPSDTVVFGPISVSGYINLAFDGLFAADGITGVPPTPRYDVGEGLEVAWSIDGSAFTTALAFKAEFVAGDTTNLNIRKDIDLNGFGEGGILGPAFSSHGFSIPSTGTNLTIRVTGISSASQEEFAFDNLTINGDVSTTNQPPSAVTLNAADVGEPQIGDTSYSFSVVYNDDSAIDVSTIGTADLSVSGPGGFMTITGASASPVGDGSPRTVTYTATPPGGSWNAADNGTYTVNINAIQIGDDGSPQLHVPTGQVGDFSVSATNTPPVVDVVFAPHVIHGDMGDGSYTFSVVYSDIGGVDASSISSGDVTINGPGGALSVSSALPAGPSGPSLTANYTATPPGGTWDASDNGIYTIALVAGQVLDVTGAAVAANAALHTFDVDSTCAFRESFEVPAPAYDSGLVSAPDMFYEGTRDFWTDTDGSNIDSGSGSPAIYSGKNGRRYWAGQDLDHLGADGIGCGRGRHRRARTDPGLRIYRLGLHRAVRRGRNFCCDPSLRRRRRSGGGVVDRRFGLHHRAGFQGR